jgi:hypothetical protein
MEVCKLWVFIRESFVSFERNSISYFDKLLEANTGEVRDIIPLFEVLLGITVITFLMEVRNLWVFVRELLVSFEGNSISYFETLLEANTVGVRDIILLFQILLGLLPNSSKLCSATSESHVTTRMHICIHFLVCYTYQTDL